MSPNDSHTRTPLSPVRRICAILFLCIPLRRALITRSFTRTIMHVRTWRTGFVRTFTLRIPRTRVCNSTVSLLPKVRGIPTYNGRIPTQIQQQV